MHVLEISRVGVFIVKDFLRSIRDADEYTPTSRIGKMKAMV